jgi:hypothetical protein
METDEVFHKPCLVEEGRWGVKISVAWLLRISVMRIGLSLYLCFSANELY